MKSVIASVVLAALAGLANAKVFLTNTNYGSIEVGKPFEITWADATGPVTVTLKTGSGEDLKTVTDLVSGQTTTSFTWTPSTSLSGNYALEIFDGTDVNYSPMFPLAGTATTTSASSATSSSTTAASSTLSTIITSSSASSAASSTPASSSSDSPASSSAAPTSSAAASSSSPASSSSSSATSTRASSTSASATSSATSSPNSNDARGVFAPLFAPLLVAVGAALL